MPCSCRSVAPITPLHNNSLQKTFAAAFEKVLWNNGQGLWNCFSLPDHSWPSIGPIMNMPNASVAETACVCQIVRLCKECLLVVFKVRGGGG